MCTVPVPRNHKPISYHAYRLTTRSGLDIGGNNKASVLVDTAGAYQLTMEQPVDHSSSRLTCNTQIHVYELRKELT